MPQADPKTEESKTFTIIFPENVWVITRGKPPLPKPLRKTRAVNLGIIEEHWEARHSAKAN